MSLKSKQLLVQQKKSDILVIAKIENSLGVQNFDAIVQVADGIMVARGDLGVELPLEQVPTLQKMMIRKCFQSGKPVITATQMLESMIKNPRPTRAEVSDVANAIYDSTSAIMLSGETAVGQYPILTVKTMRSIVEEAEKGFNYLEFFHSQSKGEYNDVSNSVAIATVSTLYSGKAGAVFVFTNSGRSARLVSRFRPEMPILALTPHQRVYHQLSLNWGVIPVEPAPSSNIRDAFEVVTGFALKKGIIQRGDLVVLTAGAPFGISGTTNMVLVESIGDVLVRGKPRAGKKVHGKVVIVYSSDEKKHSPLNGQIAVISRCDPSYLPLLEQALAIILQNASEDTASERYAIEISTRRGIPLLTRVDGAMVLLTEGESVTLDPTKGVVYRGK